MLSEPGPNEVGVEVQAHDAANVRKGHVFEVLQEGWNMNSKFDVVNVIFISNILMAYLITCFLNLSNTSIYTRKLNKINISFVLFIASLSFPADSFFED